MGNYPVVSSYIYIISSSNMRALLVLAVLAFAAISATTGLIDLGDCGATRDHLKINVCCTLNIDNTTAPAAAPEFDLCRCAVDSADMKHLKLTYSCNCLGVEFLSCHADAMGILSGNWTVCCDFGLGEEAVKVSDFSNEIYKAIQ